MKSKIYICKVLKTSIFLIGVLSLERKSMMMTWHAVLHIQKMTRSLKLTLIKFYREVWDQILVNTITWLIISKIEAIIILFFIFSNSYKTWATILIRNMGREVDKSVSTDLKVILLTWCYTFVNFNFIQTQNFIC